MKKVDLESAAEYFGISTDAMRKRIARGKAYGIKELGQWYVFIPDNNSEIDRQMADKYGQIIDRYEKQIESLEKQINHLQQESYQKNVIIRELSQKVPELPAGKPWWQRMFGKNQ